MKDAVAALFEQALDQLIEEGIIQAANRKAVQIENTRDPAHGDLATNVAMMHAKVAQMAPRDMADVIIDKLPPSKMIRHVEIAGPGFINLYLAQETTFEPVIHCLEHNEQFGHHCTPTSESKLNMYRPIQRGPCMSATAEGPHMAPRW